MSAQVVRALDASASKPLPWPRGLALLQTIEQLPKRLAPQRELASHIVETKSGHFDPQSFEDQYEDALKELLKKKQAGEIRSIAGLIRADGGGQCD